MNIHEHENNEYSIHEDQANFNICTLTLMVKSNSVQGTNFVNLH